MKFQHEVELLKYLDGTWVREDNKLTLTIFSGHIMRVITITYPPGDFIDSSIYSQKLFSVKFDSKINSWRISGIFFGDGSVMSDITEDSFHITVNPNTIFVPAHSQQFKEFKVAFNRR